MATQPVYRNPWPLPEPPISKWMRFLSKNHNVKFVWLQFLSYTSNTYTRIVTLAKFTQMVENGQRLSISHEAFSLAPGDSLVDEELTDGSFSILPDLDTAYCQAHSEGTRVVIQCDCVDSTTGQPLERCARSLSRRLCAKLQSSTGLVPVIGFEVEVVFLKREPDAVTYTPIGWNHQWSTITQEDCTNLDLIEGCMSALETVSVRIEQVHAEAAPGQWEFVLSPDWPLRALDTLLKARDTIRVVARSFGVHATWHPRLWPDRPGTGAHVHMSLYDPWKGHEPKRNTYYMKKFQHFMAGVLQHLPAIMAFSLPQEISYERVKPGIWSGGEYACWGLDNKETPLRFIEENHFELRMIDGLANPYLVFCAMLRAGEDGIEKQMSLVTGQVETAPAKLPPAKREALRLLPKTLRESLEALENDLILNQRAPNVIEGHPMVSTYIAIKREEVEILRKMEPDERRAWLISRY
ncbi:hypothetical protein SI65_09509 [Aspergillus cristatus]|uniref:Glutamine synthetase n=1 Tax=Aspergillus cristatus TaxID=573508 RepID=A0A1E3B269_ASPCR|nr:hypothetical protein SI65_09509 [Aspergillus cristatus]